ncbi:PucR family transcriptional regulator [Actinocrispum wychmicini]|uniref:PucR-like helix-turn-helix protein n=1 Tax=Actinocrispum wychmicini TaxID=1213861 RepID=A0A4R2JTZ1_9PSEU|nr:PucR family transcriptional regulator [Actinocrispum wychmicini]TCO60726.1 PucR-like helix-turn-helix protein [Actinocrispum wychmicini]
MRVRDLLGLTELRLVPLTGDTGLDRPIRWVFTTDLPDPRRYLSGGELLLTGLMWRRGPADSAAFAAAAAAGHIACLAAGDAAYGSVPDDLVAACREHDIPLLEVPVDVSFGTITEQVIQALMADRHIDLANQLGRQRRLLTAVADRAGLDALLRLSATDAEVPCWLLTATGRAPAQLPSALSNPRSRRLAAQFLGATRLPHVIHITHGVVPTTYSLFQVGGGPRVTGWFLAFEGDHRHWPRMLHDTVTELVSLVALERERFLDARRAQRAPVERLVRLTQSDHPNPTDLKSAFAEGGLPDGHYTAVTATMTDEPDGSVACAVLEELLATLPDPARTAALGDEAVALVPGAAVDLQSQAQLLETGLLRNRLTLGVSLPAAGPDGLPGALHEARQARLLAEKRPGRISMVATDEIDSHTLLLTTVPLDIRHTFRLRVLGPVLDYDRTHHTDLVPTLKAFLDCSGSWTQCAEQLHLHINTLRYRIQRIEDLTGRSLSTLESRVDFFLALRAE